MFSVKKEENGCCCNPAKALKQATRAAVAIAIANRDSGQNTKGVESYRPPAATAATVKPRVTAERAETAGTAIDTTTISLVWASI